MQSLKPALGARLYEGQWKVGQLVGKLGVAHAVLMSGLSIAAALIFLALVSRYAPVNAGGGMARLDQLTGDVHPCSRRMREERGADGYLVAAYMRIECAPELKRQ